MLLDTVMRLRSIVLEKHILIASHPPIKGTNMSTPSTGTVTLIGAGEYLPAIAEVDQQLLKQVTGHPTHRRSAQGGGTRRFQSLPNVGYKWALTIFHSTRCGS